MKKISFVITCFFIFSLALGQTHVEVKIDTVKIANGELVINNDSKDTLGYLYNLGNGVTKFKTINLAASALTDFPLQSGNGGRYLTTDGSSLSWGTVSGLTGSGSASRVTFWDGTSSISSNSNFVWDNTNSRLGVVQSSPTAKLHLGAGSATANTAPLKFTSGTDLTTPEAGTIEFNGSRLAFTPSSTRKRIALSNDAVPSNGQILIGNGTDFTTANVTAGTGITVTNASGSITISTTATASQTLTDASTVTWNCTNGYNAKLTTTSAVGNSRTLSITNAATGSYGTLVFLQDGSGGRSITLPANSKVASNWGSGTTINTSTAASAVDILTWYYDGTNFYFNIGKNYQ